MNPFDELQPFTWPASQLDEAIIALAQKSGFLSDALDSPTLPPNLRTKKRGLNDGISAVANWLGIEAESIRASYAEVDQLLRHGGPALFQLPSQSDEPRFLLLMKARLLSRHAYILAPDFSLKRVKASLIRAAWCYQLEAPLLPEVSQFLRQIGLAKKRWPDASAAMLRERLRHQQISGCWLLRLSPSAPFMTQARHARFPLYLTISIFGQAVEAGIIYGVMGMIGLSALEGELEWVWFLAGLLIWLTAIPFLWLKTWVDKLLAIELGLFLKKRLLYGVLRLNPEEVQLQGEGQFLGWVMDSERLEETNVRSLPMVLGAIVSLLFTAIILTLGAGGLFHGLLLLAWLAFAALISWRAVEIYFVQSQYYSRMTTDLVERLQGHQTRLVQEKDWVDREDQTLAHYLSLTEKDDINRTILLVVVPYGWLVFGLLGVVDTFITEPTEVVALGTSFLGILMAFQFLQQFVMSMSDLARAIAAWRLITPLYQATTRQPPKGSQIPLAKSPKEGQVIVDARHLNFRYKTGKAVLVGCDLQIHTGDRFLLEGPSGGGKSTLAALLIGLQTPQSGLLLLRGLDQQTIGSQLWRQLVVGAPQFHENHVLNASFAFNLLMGRGWPASDSDLVEAEAVCRELGLGELISRMPLGLNQVVGEEGWRLSHGERSRLYIARALLQDANLIILDESFGSLDPESMQVALRCVLRRAPTLLVIAHP
jgi:ATP-binding cassette subfamily B protein